MICKLCKEEKPLIKAHVYPEWAYKAIYPDGVVDNKRPLLVISVKKDYVSKSRIGIYDDTILCAECDGMLGKMYDGPAKEIILNIKPDVFKEIDAETNVYTLKDVSPSLLKNFILSLLLRAIWSNREEYNHVSIDESLLPILESIVKDNRNSSMYEFSVVVSNYSSSSKMKKASKNYIGVPLPYCPGENVYWIINLPNGYKFYIKGNIHEKNDPMTPLYLRENYPIYVSEFEKFEDSSELKMLQPNLSKAKKYHR